MYGVLYAISPELFPAKDRGTGSMLVFTAARIFGLIVSAKDCFSRYRLSDVPLGSYHCSVRGSDHSSACLDFWCDYNSRRRLCPPSPLRTEGESFYVDSRTTTPRVLRQYLKHLNRSLVFLRAQVEEIANVIQLNIS